MVDLAPYFNEKHMEKMMIIQWIRVGGPLFSEKATWNKYGEIEG